MSELFDPHDSTPPKQGLLQWLILAMFCLFTVRLWYLQVHRGLEFAERSEENQIRRESIYAPRGLIRDRKGVLLASNEPAYALGMVREDCHDVDATLAAVSGWTGQNVEELRAVYNKNRHRAKPFEPLILVPDLTFAQLSIVEANAPRWPGLGILARSRRTYIYGEIFSHVLGYVAEANEKELGDDSELVLGDDVGKAGLERTMELRLRGHKGLREYQADVTGRHLAERVARRPEVGESLRISIDMGLQKRVHELMGDKAGVVVVMDADSGQLLVLLSSPGFDPNVFGAGLSSQLWRQLNGDPSHPLLNRVTQSTYPPGSVFKLVLAGCGLSNGLLDPSETVLCPGYMALGNHVFHCWRRIGHGLMDLNHALLESCDVYFYRLGMKLGVDRIHDFAVACGFSKPTGVDLPHEKSGLIPSRAWKEKTYGERWQKGEDLNLGIGQGYTLVTPLQVARYISAVINGGRLLKPQLLADAPPEVQNQIPLGSTGRNIIKHAMINTVEDPRGTCRRVCTPDVVVGAKTGTAQVTRLTDELRAMPEDKIPYKLRDHAWMAGFAEQGDRRYAIAVMVEHGIHGGSGAGPVVKGIIHYLFIEHPDAASEVGASPGEVHS